MGAGFGSSGVAGGDKGSGDGSGAEEVIDWDTDEGGECDRALLV